LSLTSGRARELAEGVNPNPIFGLTPNPESSRQTSFLANNKTGVLPGETDWVRSPKLSLTSGRARQLAEGGHHAVQGAAQGTHHLRKPRFEHETVRAAWGLLPGEE